MNFLKSARSLIFKMLKNAGKSWKILFTLIIPRALNFSAFSRDLPVQVRFTGFFVVRGLFKFFFVNKQLVFRDLVLLSVCWTRVSHRGCWADDFSLSCRRRRRLCCSKRESESPESYLDKETGVFFFVSHAGRRDDDRVLVLPSNEAKKKCRGRRRRLHVVAAEIALLRFRRHFSPWLLGTSGRCHSIMPLLFILFIQCWKIQFILFNN